MFEEGVVIPRGTSTEELGYGTYTRTASISYTETTNGASMSLSFKFKATISGPANLGNQIVKRAIINVYLSYSEILTISTRMADEY